MQVARHKTRRHARTTTDEHARPAQDSKQVADVDRGDERRAQSVEEPDREQVPRDHADLAANLHDIDDGAPQRLPAEGLAADQLDVPAQDQHVAADEAVAGERGVELAHEGGERLRLQQEDDPVEGGGAAEEDAGGGPREQFDVCRQGFGRGAVHAHGPDLQAAARAHCFVLFCFVLKEGGGGAIRVESLGGQCSGEGLIESCIYMLDVQSLIERAATYPRRGGG